MQGKIAQPEPPLLLLIDDETSVGRFLAHGAEECGFRAVATTGSEGFMREYRQRKPDIIALDLAIPGGDGIELLRFLCEQKCEAPIVIISGFDRRVLDSTIRLGEAMGLRMAGFLSKPVRFKELALLLDTLETARPR